MAKKKKKERDIKRAIRISFFLTVTTVFLYLAVGYFAGWGIIFSDIQHKGRVAGASIAAVVRVFGPPSKPAVIATTSCTSQKNSYIQLSWGSDENSTGYDVYRNGAELMLGVTENLFDDLSVTNDSSYVYDVVANGPQGSATSDVVTATAAKCPSVANPAVVMETFQEESVSSFDGTPETTDRKPLFQGSTNIPNATIELEVHSSEIVYATTTANINGYWQWSTPVNLSYDWHTLYVKATDPTDPSVFANTSFEFKIKKEEDNDNKDSKAGTISSSISYSPVNTTPNLSAEESINQQPELPIENTKPLDFEMEIKNTAYVKGVSISEEVYRGENLEVNISFSDVVEENREINLQYTLSSLDQKVLADYNDNVKINRGKEITKKIPLSYNLETGKYKIQISAIIDGTTVSHEDYFILKDRPALQLAIGSISYVDLANNIGWLAFGSLLILLLLISAAIWEHRLTQGVVTQITEKILKKKGFIH